MPCPLPGFRPLEIFQFGSCEFLPHMSTFAVSLAWRVISQRIQTLSLVEGQDHINTRYLLLEVFPCDFTVYPVSSPLSWPQPPEDDLAAPRCLSQAPGPKECPPSSGQTAGYLPTIPAIFSPASRLRGKLFLRPHYEHSLKRYCLWRTLSHQPAPREISMSKAFMNSRVEIHSCSSNTHSYFIAS